MKRKTASFPVQDIVVKKQQILNWANRFNICCFLDNHQYPSDFSSAECLAAAGMVDYFSATTQILPQLQGFCTRQTDWLFGHISYDLKNEIEGLASMHDDPIGFPLVYFFRPQTVVQLQNNTVTIASLNEEPADVYTQICHSQPVDSNLQTTVQSIIPRISKQEYIATVQQLLQHIAHGDCYEINYCQEFFCSHADIDPLSVYRQLTGLSPNPFSGFYKLNDKYLLCASPERYLRKNGNRILSQPMKGTNKRDTGNIQADELLKTSLQLSEKDRSENVMVVDLVRNDLSRISKEGTVRVDELFGVYSFPQVHQMISTVSGELKEGEGLVGILKASFPMGSMTGAPKRRVMELIEQYEKTKRGIYSGALGYISPEKDFDFNVVIRSIMYNQQSRYLSYIVGGGITAYSDPEKEYEECLLKAAAIEKVLKGL